METLREFNYISAKTVGQAALLLKKHGKKAAILAGGTDLIILMREGLIFPKHIINIKSISSLDYMRGNEQEGLSIGALTRISTMLELDSTGIFASLLDAARSFATPQVRNMATIGGNVCRSVSNSDMVLPLITLDAQLKLAGSEGERVIPIASFITGPGRNLLDDEVLTEIKIPPLKSSTKMCGTAFEKVVRTSVDLAIVSCAVRVVIDNGNFQDISLAFGAVAPTPVRARNAEQVLRGQKVSTGLISKAVERIPEDIAPRTKHEYKIHVSKTLATRLINKAINRAGK